MVLPVVIYGGGSWTIKKTELWKIGTFELWCQRRLESPMDCKEIKPANPKGNHFWIFNGRTDAEAPILWAPDAKSQLAGREPDTGKDWRQKEKGVTEDKMVGMLHCLSRHEFEQTMGDNDGQRSLERCSSWGRKESAMPWQLNNNNEKQINWKVVLEILTSQSQGRACWKSSPESGFEYDWTAEETDSCSPYDIPMSKSGPW